MNSDILGYISGIHHDLATNEYRTLISIKKLILIYSSYTVFFASCFLLFISMILIGFYRRQTEGGTMSKAAAVLLTIRSYGQAPMLFAALYLSMIPVFATLYVSLPENSLYSSTRRLGDNYYQDSYNYRKAIEDSIDPNIKKSIISILRERELGANISIQNIKEFDDDFIGADFFVEVVTLDDFQRRGAINATLYIARPLLHQAMEVDDEKRINIAAFVGNVDCSVASCDALIARIKSPPSSTSDVAALLQRPPPSAVPIEMRMNSAQFKIYSDLNNALNGNALGNYGRLSRALYFSTVVTTTLGFGDIVPISDDARFYIMMQSIMGIVVAGLFLNSLASKSAGRSA